MVVFDGELCLARDLLMKVRCVSSSVTITVVVLVVTSGHLIASWSNCRKIHGAPGLSTRFTCHLGMDPAYPGPGLDSAKATHCDLPGAPSCGLDRPVTGQGLEKSQKSGAIIGRALQALGVGSRSTLDTHRSRQHCYY